MRSSWSAVAARGCVSDNFAWELHRLASAYPDQAEAATDVPTARIRAEHLWQSLRRMRLQSNRNLGMLII
jgi:hypothetical protein